MSDDVVSWPGQVVTSPAGAVLTIDVRDEHRVVCSLGHQPQVLEVGGVATNVLLVAIALLDVDGDVEAAGQPSWIPTKRAIEMLLSFGLLQDVEDLHERRTVAARRAAALPYYRLGAPHPPIGVADLPSALVDYSAGQLNALREMQRIAASVYGRLEIDRALNWTLEELGEVAQALRRHEGDTRVAEELGQLFSWVLCLANITGIDLARAARFAFQQETMRQNAKYGQLHPYQAVTPK